LRHVTRTAAVRADDPLEEATRQRSLNEELVHVLSSRLASVVLEWEASARTSAHSVCSAHATPRYSGDLAPAAAWEAEGQPGFLDELRPAEPPGTEAEAQAQAAVLEEAAAVPAEAPQQEVGGGSTPGTGRGSARGTAWGSMDQLVDSISAAVQEYLAGALGMLLQRAATAGGDDDCGIDS
jgi:hypothetical protein